MTSGANGNPVTIIMIEDDEGHARLIERNIRRAGVNNEIVGFSDGSSALAYLMGPDGTGLQCETRDPGFARSQPSRHEWDRYSRAGQIERASAPFSRRHSHDHRRPA